jgi:hypothetical protein
MIFAVWDFVAAKKRNAGAAESPPPWQLFLKQLPIVLPHKKRDALAQPRASLSVKSVAIS